MPSRRSRASRSPRLPLARHLSASATIRTLSATLKTRRGRFATVSRGALPALPAGCWRPASGVPLRSGTRVGLGTICDPFSAHRYLDFQGALSHVTLAQGVVDEPNPMFDGDTARAGQ